MPVDALVDRIEATLSVGVRECCCRLGTNGSSFARAAGDLLGYVGERREMLRYAECDEHGWDVGSGPIESMCKQLTHRLKGPGMRWDRQNIQAITALECLYQSGQDAAYWKCQMQNN